MRGFHFPECEKQSYSRRRRRRRSLAIISWWVVLIAHNHHHRRLDSRLVSFECRFASLEQPIMGPFFNNDFHRTRWWWSGLVERVRGHAHSWNFITKRIFRRVPSWSWVETSKVIVLLRRKYHHGCCEWVARLGCFPSPINARLFSLALSGLTRDLLIGMLVFMESLIGHACYFGWTV